MVFTVPCHPPFLRRASEGEYRLHYESLYCQGPITDYLGLPIRFRKEQFDHVFFESAGRNRIKDIFSQARAERLDWILTTLQSTSSVQYEGWDSFTKRYDPNFRVTNVFGSFVVIVRVVRSRGLPVSGEFRTAYWADNSIGKIRTGPPWVP